MYKQCNINWQMYGKNVILKEVKTKIVGVLKIGFKIFQIRNSIRLISSDRQNSELDDFPLQKKLLNSH